MMKKILFLLPLLVAVLFLGACESEAPLLAPVVEDDTIELQVRLGVTNDNDYVPFGSVTIPMVTDGSGEFSYELYRQGELIGNEPIKALRFDEPGITLIKLKVIDLQTGETGSASITVVAQSALPGAPLEATLYIPKSWGFAPFAFSALGIARGGTLPYSYEMLIDGELVVPEDVLRWQINELGNHEVLFRVTDADGNVAQQFGDVLVTERQSGPVMQIAFNALPSTVKIGQKVGLITNVYGGQPPYQFEISVGDQIISTEPTVLYQVNDLGEQMAKVKVTDATGMGSETVAWFYGEEPYLHPVQVDISGQHEQQVDNPFYLHADVDGGPWDELRWYHTDETEPFAWGRDIVVIFDNPGFEYVTVQVYYMDEYVTSQIKRLTVTPADPVILNNVTAAVSHGPVPRWTSVDADAYGGVGILNYVWRKGNDVVGYGESIDYQMTTISPDTLWVTVTDEIGQWDNGSVILTGEINGTITYEWMIEPNLQVGPSQSFDTTVVFPPYPGEQHIWILAEFDTQLSDQGIMVLEFVYSDGHKRIWNIFDIYQDRPTVLMIELGMVRIDPTMTINLTYLNPNSNKCDGLNKVYEVHGSLTQPITSNSNVKVVHLSEEGIAFQCIKY